MMKHKLGQLWSQPEKDYLREQYENGFKKIGELAIEQGVSKGTIKQILSRINAKRIGVSKICPECQKSFVTTNVFQKKFCNHRCIDKFYRKYRPQYRAKTNERQRQKRIAFAKLWGATGWKPDYHPVVIASEEFVAKQLENQGFTDVVVTRNGGVGVKRFPFDIMAKKNGEIHCFDATTSCHKVVSYRIRFLLRYLGVKHFHICHVKPDLTWWCDRNVDRKVSSNCSKEYWSYIRKAS